MYLYKIVEVISANEIVSYEQRRKWTTLLIHYKINQQSTVFPSSNRVGGGGVYFIIILLKVCKLWMFNIVFAIYISDVSIKHIFSLVLCTQGK